MEPTEVAVDGVSPTRADSGGRSARANATTMDEPVDVNPARLEPGDTIDQFEVIRFLAAGGMGEVYLARDPTLGRRVAIKLVHPRIMESREAADRFLFEARATAEFNHPNIVTIHAAGTWCGRPYVALEYLEGQTLRERLNQQRLGMREALRIIHAVAEAVAEAHGHGILHRDLKPENTIIPRDGRVRVVDFGLARRIELPESPSESGAAAGDASITRANGLLGTPMYMAPEQWRNQEVCAATDVWAIGVMLYEMLAGDHPFSRVRSYGLMTAVLTPHPVPRLQGVSADIADLLDACLQKEPSQRPSAAEVASLTARWIAGSAHPAAAERRPFRGLRVFEESHASLFFGRESETEALVERLRSESLLHVVGPSGAGKSSFVRAGVVPRLREQGRWLVIMVRPGVEPARALALAIEGARSGQDLSDGSFPTGEPTGKSDAATPEAQGSLFEEPGRLGSALRALARSRSVRVLLVIDQLEEVYTMVRDPAERARFLSGIYRAAGDASEPVRVVLTVRDDFLGRVAESSEVRTAIAQVFVLRAPAPELLREAIARPLQAVGHGCDDDGLIDDMVREVQGEASALPLLQFAADALWDRRDAQRRLLLRQAYTEMGGVAGAMAAHAELVVAGLPPGGVQVARELLLRLVTSQGTRRVCLRAALLEGLAEDASEVLRRLSDARLLTLRRARAGGGEPEVEIAHEALLKSWKQLSRWLDESREDLEFLADATVAAQRWDKRGRREEDLWRGKALSDAEAHAVRVRQAAPALVVRFLQSSSARQRQLRRRARTAAAGAIAALAAIAVVGIAVSLVLHRKERDAQQSREQARASEQRANERHAESLVEAARLAWSRSNMLEARARLRAALEVRDSAMARALWRKLEFEPDVWRIDLGTGAYGIIVFPDGDRVAVGGTDGSVYVLDIVTSQVTRFLRGGRSGVYSLALSAAADRVAAGLQDGSVCAWWLSNDEPSCTGVHTGAIPSLAFHAGHSVVVSVGRARALAVTDLDGSRRDMLRIPSDRAMAASPSGAIAVAEDATLHLLAPDTLAKDRSLPGSGAAIAGLAFSRDGKRLASVALDGAVQVRDLASDGVINIASPAVHYPAIAFHPNGRILATGTTDGAVTVMDTEPRAVTRSFDAHEHSMTSAVQFDSDGETVLSSGAHDRQVVRTRWQTPNRESLFERQPHISIAFDSSGGSLFAGSSEGNVQVFDVATGAARDTIRKLHDGTIYAVRPLPGDRILTTGSDRFVRVLGIKSHAVSLAVQEADRVYDASIAPLGERVALGLADGTAAIRDTATGQRLAVLRTGTLQCRAVAFSSDGRALATANTDGTVRWFDTSTWREKKTWAAPGVVNGVAVLGDGRILYKERLSLLRVAGEAQATGTDIATSWNVVLHPDGRRVGVTGLDGKAGVFDPAGGAPVRFSELRTTEDINHMAFSPDGKLAATASDDGTVRTWVAESGRAYWRSPMLSRATRRILTHRGWEPVGGGAASPPASAWDSAVAQSALVASEADGGAHVCLLQHANEWQIRAGDQLPIVARGTLQSLTSVSAVPSGCVVLHDWGARLVTLDGEIRNLAEHATAAAWSGSEILVASPSLLLRFDPRGKELQRWPGHPGVSAIARAGEWIATGHVDGTLEWVNLDPRRTAPSVEGRYGSRVVSLIEGPAGTLVSGRANGDVMLSHLDSGALLDAWRVHGAAIHLWFDGTVLFVGSDVGDTRAIDLSVFKRSHCALLREVGQRVPVVWDQSRAVKRAWQPGPACAL